MDARLSTNIRNSDKYFVAEQRGLRYFLPGLLAALFMGLTVRALFSPKRVQYEIERAIENSKPNGQITLESATLSFANGWSPELAVVVTNLFIKSDDPCEMQPQIRIGVLRMPVSFRALLNMKLDLKEISIDEAEGTLDPSREACPSTSAKKETRRLGPLSSGLIGGGGVSGFIGSKGSSQAPREPIVQTLSVKIPILKSIEIKSLKLRLTPWPKALIWLQNMSLDVESTSLLSAKIKGKFQILHEDTEKLINPIQGQLEIDVRTGHIHGEIHGIWREGNLNIVVDQEDVTKRITAVLEARQIPLSQVVFAAKEHGWMKNSFTGGQTWVSSQMRFEVKTDGTAQVSSEGLHIEGDFGDIQLQKFELDRTPGQSFDLRNGVNARFVNVDLDKFWILLNLPVPNDSLERLGVLNGNLIANETNSMNFSGTVDDLGFKISHRGHRAIQTIKRVNVMGNVDKNRVDLHLNSVEILDGKFNGEGNFRYFLGPKNFAIDLAIDALDLSPTIESILTSKGHIGDLSGRLKAEWDEHSLLSIKGVVDLNESEIDSVEFDRIKIDLGMKGHGVTFKIGAPSSLWKPSSPAYGFLYTFLGLTQEHKPFRVRELSCQTTLAGKGFYWDLQANLPEEKMKVSGVGNWDEAGNLTGDFALKTEGLESVNRVLHGTRSEPKYQ